MMGALMLMVATAGSCTPAVNIVTEKGSYEFRVDVRDTDEGRSRGMMFVPSIGDRYGMLFVYKKPQKLYFWMKNTIVGLDILFLSAEGEVLKVHENAIPFDETLIEGPDLAQMALEIRAGIAVEIGLKPGDKVSKVFCMEES